MERQVNVPDTPAGRDPADVLRIDDGWEFFIATVKSAETYVSRNGNERIRLALDATGPSGDMTEVSYTLPPDGRRLNDLVDALLPEADKVGIEFELSDLVGRRCVVHCIRATWDEHQGRIEIDFLLRQTIQSIALTKRKRAS